MGEHDKTWVEGRVRESADGLGERSNHEQAKQRMREAAEREAQKSAEAKEKEV